MDKVELSLTPRQSRRLEVKPRTQWSPYLEKCCLLLSANEAYARADDDITVLTRAYGSGSTQQRLVHRQDLAPPAVDSGVKEMSLDGGKVPLGMLLGKPCQWRNYKAINLHQCHITAFYKDNDSLVNWLSQQPLAHPLVCLGDGHDGIWDLFAQIGHSSERLEILDWYHLMENLGNLGGYQQRLDAVEACLWQGDVDGAVRLLDDWRDQWVEQFIGYLAKHRHRILNYSYYQAEGISIGSGAVESTIKQISRRVKISGAQWKEHNVPQVLRHRCAYLNGRFSF